MPEAEATVEGVRVVWWALLAGGVLGGFAKMLMDGEIVMPRLVRLDTTSETLILPGFVTPLILGPVAAFIMAGAGAATFDFQTSFDSRGFWGPFVGSIPAGLGATYVLAQIAHTKLHRAAERLLQEAEAVEGARNEVES